MISQLAEDNEVLRNELQKNRESNRLGKALLQDEMSTMRRERHVCIQRTESLELELKNTTSNYDRKLEIVNKKIEQKNSWLQTAKVRFGSVLFDQYWS